MDTGAEEMSVLLGKVSSGQFSDEINGRCERPTQ